MAAKPDSDMSKETLTCYLSISRHFMQISMGSRTAEDGNSHWCLVQYSSRALSVYCLDV